MQKFIVVIATNLMKGDMLSVTTAELDSAEKFDGLIEELSQWGAPPRWMKLIEAETGKVVREWEREVLGKVHGIPGDIFKRAEALKRQGKVIDAVKLLHNEAEMRLSDGIAFVKEHMS